MSKHPFNLQTYIDEEPHDERFILKNEPDIRALLTHLQKKQNHITGHLENSSDVFATSILAIDKNNLTLAGVPDEALSKRILECPKLMFSSFHAGVPVRFISSLIAKRSFYNEIALMIPFPPEVLWRQRREFFRAPVPSVKPALCEMDLKTGEITRNPLSDISVGGLGLLVSTSSTALNRGLLIDDCAIDLPGFGVLRSGIQICNESLLESRSGHVVKRYGCKFMNIHQRDQALLQRYVIKLESDMHAARTHA